MNYYEIFRKCFPQFSFGEAVFNELSGIERGRVFTCSDNDNTIGFAIAENNNIRLICVLPGYQGKGYGSELLTQAEEYIVSQKNDCVNIGGCDSGLFIGAVQDSKEFFEKHGYTLYDETVAEMCGDTEALVAADYPLPDNISFGFYDGDINRLKAAVGAVEVDWVQYFNGGELFCAFDRGKIVSFCIVEESVQCLFTDGKSKVGSIGCVGTVPDYRRQGIGLKMVSLAAGELKKRSCDKIFIHYTGVYDWYAKLGFEAKLYLKIGYKRV